MSRRWRISCQAAVLAMAIKSGADPHAEWEYAARGGEQDRIYPGTDFP
jgi:hypothetical protein